MSNIELTGTITKIGDIQTFASGFQKRELILTTQEQYPQPIAIEFLQDKVDLPDAHKVGDTVTVGINIRGRSWTSPQGETKYFNSIVGWKIIANTTAESTQTNQQASTETETSKTKIPTATADQAFGDDEEDSGDLPF